MNESILGLTAEITVACITSKLVNTPEKLPGLIAGIAGALAGLGEPETPEYTPAVDPKKSVKPDHIISLIDGTKHSMLKRHLTTHGLTPDEYRQRYNLPADYPMVSRAYSEVRRELAKKMGLGTKANRKGKGK